MKRSDIRALGVSEELTALFDAYTDALQDDSQTGEQSGEMALLARFMITAYRDGIDFDGSHIQIALPFEVWGNDIPLQQADYVDAMAAVLTELDDL